VTAGQGGRAARVLIAAFAVGAAVLVWAVIWGPAWSAPLVLVCLGLLSAALPRGNGSRRPSRRISLYATVLGLLLLARALGWL
jgi:hypothetical protein